MNLTQSRRGERGIVCPNCGCRHFHTTNTEPLHDGRIRRRKECRHCGRRIVTYEFTKATPGLQYGLSRGDAF
jgi:DNA-directed RNA polymerase subunit RPC12/RpoP